MPRLGIYCALHCWVFIWSLADCSERTNHVRRCGKDITNWEMISVPCHWRIIAIACLVRCTTRSCHLNIYYRHCSGWTWRSISINCKDLSLLSHHIKHLQVWANHDEARCEMADDGDEDDVLAVVRWFPDTGELFVVFHAVADKRRSPYRHHAQPVNIRKGLHSFVLFISVLKFLTHTCWNK